MKKKITYKVRNWGEYNQSLINRGNITLWVNERAIDSWISPPSSKRGRPFLYSDSCILLLLTLQAYFGLPLRSTQGFTEGLFTLMSLCLPVPNYTRLSRRSKLLELPSFPTAKGPINLVIDATGLKIYGEGEWKMRVHGKDKRRGWRKLHLAMDPDNFQIVAMELTDSKTSDGKVLPALLESIDEIGEAYADGAYMYKECFEAIDDKGGQAIINLRGGTSLSQDPTPGLEQRNRIVKEIWDSGGKKEWKKVSGYHRRSLVETQMYRWKKLLGATLSSRKWGNQKVEAMVKGGILNKITTLGMPDTVAIVG